MNNKEAKIYNRSGIEYISFTSCKKLGIPSEILSTWDPLIVKMNPSGYKYIDCKLYLLALVEEYLGCKIDPIHSFRLVPHLACDKNRRITAYEKPMCAKKYYYDYEEDIGDTIDRLKDEFREQYNYEE